MPFSEVTKIGPPAPDQIEVSIFGPNFGECIVVHFGSNRWLVIDSCEYPGISGGPVALRYLGELGVIASAAIERIIITHWHSDHCKGVSQIAETCPHASIWLASALTTREFMTFVKRLSKNKTTTAALKTVEFSSILSEILKRKKAGLPTYGVASQNSLIQHAPASELAHGGAFKLVALSPSHGDHLDFLTRIAAQMPRAGKPKRSLGSPTPNEVSVASLLEIGDAAILLGADLENSKPSSGWDAVVAANRNSRFGAKAGVYKIPHHGSLTGHNADVWAEMLESSPIAVLSPWRLGRGRLPAPAGVKAITARTRNAYATSAEGGSRARKRHPSVQTFLRSNNIRVHSLEAPTGFVRLRKRRGEQWSIELFGAACRLGEFIRRRGRPVREAGTGVLFSGWLDRLLPNTKA
jgi:beta-lactamase superfamily II metal-dependent hydrolase